MKKLLAAALAACALVLAGCMTPAPNPVTGRTVYQLRLSYDSAFLVPAANYRRLGLCPGEAKSTFAAPCAERFIVRKLQVVDRKVQIALTNLDTFQRNYPSLDASTYVAAAIASISTAQQVLADAGVQRS